MEVTLNISNRQHNQHLPILPINPSSHVWGLNPGKPLTCHISIILGSRCAGRWNGLSGSVFNGHAVNKSISGLPHEKKKVYGQWGGRALCTRTTCCYGQSWTQMGPVRSIALAVGSSLNLKTLQCNVKGDTL